MDDHRQGSFEVSGVRVVRAADLGAREVRPVFAEARVIKARVLSEIGQVADELEQARAAADKLVQDARDDATQVTADAHESGWARGFGEWSAAVEALRAERERIVAEAESDLLELATRMAGRVIGRSIELDPRIAVEAIAEALQHVRGDSQVTIEVAPDDLAVVEQYRGELQRMLGGETFHVKGNPAVARGGCIIATASQQVDARVATQLESLARALEAGHGR